MKKQLIALLAVTSTAYAEDPKAPKDAPKPEAPKPETAKEKAVPGGVAKSLVAHIAPTTTQAGKPIEIEAMIDAPFAEQLSVRWRAIGGTAWQDVPFERSSAGGWFASLPAAASPGIEYYIRGKDLAGTESEHFATERAPHVVRVDPALYDRLEALDRERLANRVDEVAVDVVAHNFGNRYGLEDWFIRSEAVYSHHVLRALHRVGFGFGSITGRTPENRMPESAGGSMVLLGMRYGFGEVRLRVHPSVFLDGRVGLGVSHDNFEGLGKGSITFGKPWRSCVTVGGEYFGDLGPVGFVRLQWDTAFPFLMGASVVRSDLPGAIVDPAGLYIAYDVSYQMAQRFTVRAQLSYGARDGAAHAGGGLGTAFAF